MTAIRTLPLTTHIIDAFADRLPAGDVREALSEMALMPYKSLFVHDGYVEMKGDRIIGNADSVIDGEKYTGTRCTDRTIIIQRGLSQVTDVTMFNDTRIEAFSQREASLSASIEDVLYACGCLGRIPNQDIIQVTLLKQTLRIPLIYK